MFNLTLNYVQLYLISFRKLYKLPLHSHCFFQFLCFVLQLREVLKRPLNLISIDVQENLTTEKKKIGQLPKFTLLVVKSI